MKNQLSTSEIQQIVSNITKISVTDILSKSRKAEIVQARHLSMYFSRFNTNQNLLTIANQHGKDNHATVIHACSAIHYDKRSNVSLAEKFQTIETIVKNS
jgi:chromosomal replication initiator protein